MKWEAKEALMKEIKGMMKSSHKAHEDFEKDVRQLRRDLQVRINLIMKEEASPFWRKQAIERERDLTAEQISAIARSYSAEASYYIIYKDGSCTCVCDDDLVTGEQKMPKLTDIVYMSYSGTDSAFDTVRGPIDWYNDKQMLPGEAWDEFYERKDAEKTRYEDFIEMKFCTPYGLRLLASQVN